MKHPLDRVALLLVITLAVVLCSGCASLTKRIDQMIPEGKFETLTATEVGKFTATQIEGSKFQKDAKQVTAERFHFRHSNPWTSLIEGEVTGYTRNR